MISLPAACALLKRTAAAFPFTEAQETILAEALRVVDTGALFAVRSSSPHEDLEGASFAGGYETVLGITPNTLRDAIKRCFLSSLDYRVVVYMRAKQRYDVPPLQVGHGPAPASERPSPTGSVYPAYHRPNGRSLARPGIVLNRGVGGDDRGVGFLDQLRERGRGNVLLGKSRYFRGVT